jgi:hypothetical protein
MADLLFQLTTIMSTYPQWQDYQGVDDYQRKQIK